MSIDRDFLFRLLDTPSPVGCEAPGQRVWLDGVSGVASETGHDPYGNAWAVRQGQGGPTVLIEAHADEIGMAVRHITDKGLLHVTPLGGSDPAITRAKRVAILLDDGSRVHGIVGNTAIHLRDRSDGDKVPKWHEITIDIGCTSKDEVVERGIRVGLPIVFRDGPEMLGDKRVVARAIDNRIGGYVIARVLAELAQGDPVASSVIALNAVQEEIGGHGATVATYRLEPQVAVCIDVTHSTDTPGIEVTQHGDVKLGGGPSLTHGTINHRGVVQRLMKAASKAEISVQHEAISRSSGTDTDNIFTSRAGVPAALVSIPLRYMHSPVELVDLDDVEHCVQLLVQFIRDIKADASFDVI